MGGALWASNVAVAVEAGEKPAIAVAEVEERPVTVAEVVATRGVQAHAMAVVVWAAILVMVAMVLETTLATAVEGLAITSSSFRTNKRPPV